MPNLLSTQILERRYTPGHKNRPKRRRARPVSSLTTQRPRAVSRRVIVVTEFSHASAAARVVPPRPASRHWSAALTRYLVCSGMGQWRARLSLQVIFFLSRREIYPHKKLHADEQPRPPSEDLNDRKISQMSQLAENMQNTRHGRKNPRHYDL